MATTPKKPSREKEETREGDMSLSPHPLCVHDALPSRKQNRESRVKNACNSNSHSNIAPSNDKRPLFVQIPATSSASLVSTSLPIQCLRQTNSFFYRGIFADNFLPNLLQPPQNVLQYGSERYLMTFRTWFNTVPGWSQLRSGRYLTTFRGVFNTVPRGI